MQLRADDWVTVSPLWRCKLDGARISFRSAAWSDSWRHAIEAGSSGDLRLHPNNAPARGQLTTNSAGGL